MTMTTCRGVSRDWALRCCIMKRHNWLSLAASIVDFDCALLCWSIGMQQWPSFFLTSFYCAATLRVAIAFLLTALFNLSVLSPDAVQAHVIRLSTF